ncbi:hypothetical protein [Collimonas pratensis]|uniref:hypothetical protein n=1 Tax=Collimonas pratensis TaxID=279113 RepID=UPI0007843408|nr:hypothetical protein [Collimonas pratensis]
MKERPILFTGAMVRALLDDRKVQNRRIINPQPQMVTDGAILPWEGKPVALMQLLQQTKRPCPFGQPGDRHWVRETWAAFDADWRHPGKPHDLRDGPWPNIAYQADGTLPSGATGLWRPSIHMPRWASRIQLEVTAVRVEQLRCIKESDAQAEGVTIEDRHMNGYCAGECYPPAIRAYRELWGSLYGGGSWDANPWVWVVEFRRVLQ